MLKELFEDFNAVGALIISSCKTSLVENFGVNFLRQSRLACFSRTLDEFIVLHVVFAQAETVMLKRRPCRVVVVDPRQ